jgi:hypothetical protein
MVRTECLTVINPSKPSGHCMDRFNIQQFYVLPTVYLCVLCGYENKQRLFPYSALTDWFYNRDTECLLCGTDWIFKSNLR